jgi:GGDEF domain-containing protein
MKSKSDLKKKIKELKKLLKDSYHDDCFDIYTRKGFLNRIKGESKGHLLLFDFHNVSNLNSTIGYKKVNELISSFFDKIKNEDVVIGRWFSGDEIIIYSNIYYDFEDYFDYISKVSDDMNLFFTYTKRSVSEVEDWRKMIERMQVDLKS